MNTDLKKYRIEKPEKDLEAAKFNIENNYQKSGINCPYYAIFSICIRSAFRKYIIGKIYYDILNAREYEGYNVFRNLDEKQVLEWLSEGKKLINELKKLTTRNLNENT